MACYSKKTSLMFHQAGTVIIKKINNEITKNIKVYGHSAIGTAGRRFSLYI